MTKTDLIARFTGPNAAYYARTFDMLQARSGPVFSFNPAAALFGPLWAGMRGLSFLFLLLCFLDLVALTQVASGVWGNAGGAAIARVAQLEVTIANRRADATGALAAGNPEAAATATKLADNLQKVVDAARTEAAQSAKGAGGRIWGGIGLISLVRLLTGLCANSLYESRFSAWRGNQHLPHGAPALRLLATAGLIMAIYSITLYAVVAAAPPVWLTTFPADKALFAAVEGWLDAGFVATYDAGRGVFEGIRNAIRILVEAFEVVLVGTPWPVVMLVICTLGWQLAGPRVAIFTAAALADLGLFGFWQLSLLTVALLTVALLGAASILCILVGIPLHSRCWISCRPCRPLSI